MWALISLSIKSWLTHTPMHTWSRTCAPLNQLPRKEMPSTSSAECLSSWLGEAISNYTLILPMYESIWGLIGCIATVLLHIAILLQLMSPLIKWGNPPLFVIHSLGECEISGRSCVIFFFYMTSLIKWLSLLFGFWKPSACVKWPKDFCSQGTESSSLLFAECEAGVYKCW